MYLEKNGKYSQLKSNPDSIKVNGHLEMICTLYGLNLYLVLIVHYE